MRPETGADSWIDTPGNTEILGVDMPGDGTDASARGDTRNNGPQTYFNFARITISPRFSSYRFLFQVSIESPNNPGQVFTAEPFLVHPEVYTCIPEPRAIILLGGAGIGMFVLRRTRTRLYMKRASV